MVTNVRINEVVASIAIASGGTGRSTVEDVVKDLRRSIGASEQAAREAIARAAELQYVIKEGDVIRLER